MCARQRTKASLEGSMFGKRERSRGRREETMKPTGKSISAKEIRDVRRRRGKRMPKAREAASFSHKRRTKCVCGSPGRCAFQPNFGIHLSPSWYELVMTRYRTCNVCTSSLLSNLARPTTPLMMAEGKSRTRGTSSGLDISKTHRERRC